MRLIGSSKEAVHLTQSGASQLHRLTQAGGALQVRDFAAGSISAAATLAPLSGQSYSGGAMTVPVFGA